MVIDENNQNLGVLPRDQAIAMAEEKGLDLVMVGPRPDNPVCRFINYEKHLYQQEKKHKEVMKSQRKSTPKEVKMGIRIGPQDFETKMRRAREFLTDGLKVKIVIEFRGWRELAHSDQGYDKIDKIKVLFKEIARIESDVKREGRRIFMILSPRLEAIKPHGNAGHDQAPPAPRPAAPAKPPSTPPANPGGPKEGPSS